MYLTLLNLLHCLIPNFASIVNDEMNIVVCQYFFYTLGNFLRTHDT